MLKILGSFKSIDQFQKLLNENQRDEILQNLNDLDGIGETQNYLNQNFFNNSKNIEIIKNFLIKLNIQNFSEKNKKEN